ncbi:MAG: hypothetical protein Q7U77_14760, partial [Sediminibacterium sp.]|uniref:hypothetical protein n=1 Tax=Sediminibacterium sp. TaxID=1917865 RepID=UPI00272598BC
NQLDLKNLQEPFTEQEIINTIKELSADKASGSLGGRIDRQSARDGRDMAIDPCSTILAAPNRN